jgi:hypothetical protein
MQPDSQAKYIFSKDGGNNLAAVPFMRQHLAAGMLGPANVAARRTKTKVDTKLLRSILLSCFDISFCKI